MKSLKLFSLLAIATITTTSFAQNWRLGGNNGFPPPNNVNATNNILGTNVNVPIRVVTNGTQRVIINGAL